MSFGLQIVTGAGNVQIDAAYRNARWFYSGSTPTPSSSASHYKATVSFPVRPAAPILLVQPGSVYTACSGFNGSINGFSLYTSSQVSRSFVLADDSGHITDTGTYGLEVRNAAGQRVFDSRERPLIVEDVVGFDPRTIPRSPTTPPLDTPLTISHASVPNAMYGLLFFNATQVDIVNDPLDGAYQYRTLWLAAIRQSSNTSAQVAYMSCEVNEGYLAYTLGDAAFESRTGHVFVARVAS